MTFETMIGRGVERAEAAYERRRASVAIESLCCGGATMNMALLRQELTGNVVSRQLDPVRRALFREDHRADVDEVAVLQHLGPALRRLAGGAGRRAGGSADRVRLPSVNVDALQEHVLPLLVRVALDLLEEHVERQRADVIAGLSSDPERNAGNELVLAVDDAGVEPPALTSVTVKVSLTSTVPPQPETASEKTTMRAG